MGSSAVDADVVIVGAGPTGLTLACELAARGVRHRLLERAPERSDRSRALVVHARTLEIFQKMGFADALVARGRTAVGVSVFVSKREAAHVEIGDIGVDDTPYPFLLFVSQAETERLLEAHLETLGGRVERPVTVTGYREDEHGVSVEVENGPPIRARFVVGCDGAHSAIRHAAGLPFVGAAYEQDFLLGDVRIDWAGPTDRLCLAMGQKGILAVFPLAGGFSRLVLSRGEPPREDLGDPSLEELERLANNHAPYPLTLRDPAWLARFRLHHRAVARYRAGRAFVAGDAAHIHSPAGGQGMNTGIQDAFNLGYKLALAVQGRAGTFLLDSYDEERRPVGQRLLQFTDRLFSVGTSSNPLVIAARDLLVPFALPRILATRRRRAIFFRFLSQLAIHYRGCSVVDEVPGFSGGPRAGDRAPDGPLDGGRLFAVLGGTRFHLLAFGAPVELAARHRDLVEPHLVPSPSPLAEAYGLRGAGHYLIRPDGCVSFRAPGVDGAALADHLDRLLAR
jgi:2-polyprenyl-6-methoxyphenol hydroxylase-like FAD-dependent oxidoreductase